MIVFDSDVTLRWACCTGDYVFWARFKGMFSSPCNGYEVADIWELKDGNFVTITNRCSDLPVWFDLHPLEVSGSSVGWMQEKLAKGYNLLEGPIESPNLWRVFAGDRIVWVGPSRGGVLSENGVLELVDFRENALVYGEPFDLSGEFPAFGGFDREPSPEGARFCRVGWNALNRLGIPRTVTADNQWRIG